MTDREQTILDLTIWAVLIYLTILAVIYGYRLFIRGGDVIKIAADRTAQADRIIAQSASIDTFVTDWMEPANHNVHIAEAMYLHTQRTHTKKGHR